MRHTGRVTQARLDGLPAHSFVWISQLSCNCHYVAIGDASFLQEIPSAFCRYFILVHCHPAVTHASGASGVFSMPEELAGSVPQVKQLQYPPFRRGRQSRRIIEAFRTGLPERNSGFAVFVDSKLRVLCCHIRQTTKQEASTRPLCILQLVMPVLPARHPATRKDRHHRRQWDRAMVERAPRWLGCSSILIVPIGFTSSLSSCSAPEGTCLGVEIKEALGVDWLLPDGILHDHT